MYSQSGLFPEFGIIAGPVQFRSDYGEREDKKTNMGNSGFGIGVFSYLDFSSGLKYKYRYKTSFFKEHFKVRSEISWNKTKLDHHGKWVGINRTGIDADKLRAHKGVNQNFNFGFQLEYYLFSAKQFDSFFSPKISPYIGIGLCYTLYSAEVSTTYNNPNPNAIGDVLDASNFYSGWQPGSIRPSAGSTPSFVSAVGTRYKYNKKSDVLIELKGQYFFSDWVDGLNHQLDSNKNNDWLLWLNIGYIVKLD